MVSNITAFGINVLQPQSTSSKWDFFLTRLGFTSLILAIGGSNSMPQLTVCGEIGSTFALEHVSALPASKNWQILVTSTLTNNCIGLTDTNAAGNTSRFYRAKLVP